MIAYVDTSAAIKLLVDEDGSDAMHDVLRTWPDDATLCSSMLVFTELMCAADRRGLDSCYASSFLQALVLYDLTKSDFLQAGESRWGLRGADALHLAAARRMGADAMFTYDAELATAARNLGVTVMSPGVADSD